jgi:hypothetical protein
MIEVAGFHDIFSVPAKIGPDRENVMKTGQWAAANHKTVCCLVLACVNFY